MQKAVLFSVAAGVLLASGQNGIRPRPNSADYPTHQDGHTVTLGAAMLSPEQVKRQFAANLNKLGYVVVEVAAYPDPSKNVEINARDFMLRALPDGSTFRPVPPAVIAAQISRKDPQQHTQVPASPVQVYTGAGVGYGSGSYGGRRQGGTYGETGVGVGVGNPGQAPPSFPPPSSKGTDALSVQVELEDQALPEGRITDPVAGYLYFPKPVPYKQQKKSSLEITWFGAGEQVRLPLPSTK